VLVTDITEFDDSDDPLEDWEDPEPDLDESDESETLPCPACGEPVYEDAEQCPHCGTYVTHGTSLLSGRPTWLVVLAVLGVVTLIVALLRW
jgi:endogenous inhibitor of DNA gyrase (YacG/DUF329 family)